MTAPQPNCLAPIILRPAGPLDCERVWNWNFDPQVRERSRTRERVSMERHALWYAQRLDASRGPMWIIEESSRPVGVVRIDADGGNAGRISIALAAEARGRGIGRRAVAVACQVWGQSVVAEIRIDNYPSRSCFQACDFRGVAMRDGLVTYRWEGK